MWGSPEEIDASATADNSSQGLAND